LPPTVTIFAAEVVGADEPACAASPAKAFVLKVLNKVRAAITRLFFISVSIVFECD
jgi:hypothetical protein